MSVFAPFRFSPVNNWVYFPDWADTVSHDVPFNDGLSGSIELEILARSEVLIGGPRRTATQDVAGEVWPFQLPDGKWAIPPSTLKGCLRSLLESVSFAKLLPFMDHVQFKKGKNKKVLSPEEIFKGRIDDHLSDRPDLPSIVFGAQSGSAGGYAIKSRVAFDLALATCDQQSAVASKPMVLATPKSSYLPIYVQQSGTPSGEQLASGAEYLTYEEGMPAGRKLWPASTNVPEDRKYTLSSPPPLPSGKAGRNLETQVKLNAVPKGTTFRTCLRFHNLRPEELGALLWCISFGDIQALEGKQARYLHRIGGGKPAGLGHIAMRAVGGQLIPNDPETTAINWSKQTCKAPSKFFESSICCFERAISKYRHDNSDDGDFDWAASSPVRATVLAADPEANKALDLRYMKLRKKDAAEGELSYVQAKQDGYFLRPYADELEHAKVDGGAG